MPLYKDDELFIAGSPLRVEIDLFDEVAGILEPTLADAFPAPEVVFTFGTTRTVVTAAVDPGVPSRVFYNCPDGFLVAGPLKLGAYFYSGGVRYPTEVKEYQIVPAP